MEILVFETVTYVKIKICSSKPSSIDSWFIKPLSLSFTLRIKIWVVAILSQKRKKENIKEIICNFWVWMLQYLKQQLSFCPQKVEKATLKSYSEIIRIFFSFLSWAVQTEEFMFQNVAYRPTVHKTRDQKLKNCSRLFQKCTLYV